MLQSVYKYAIIGGGQAGASAVDGIREIDKEEPILILGAENQFPYERPPLSKKLWTGKKMVHDIFVHPEGFYPDNNVDLLLETEATSIEVDRKTVSASGGSKWGWEKLLIATGGIPRMLKIPGGDLDGIYYYRNLADYERLVKAGLDGTAVLIIGGGFIGSEIAAALNLNGAAVTMIFPVQYMCDRVFPPRLSDVVKTHFEDRGIRVLTGDEPTVIRRDGSGFVTSTKHGRSIMSDIIVVGVGIEPSTSLAKYAGLEINNGIVVNETLQTSNPDIYAAGDVANFIYTALGERRRVEHWDNAVVQGKQAGRNMAGANESYDHMPYFYSDLFDFGYEAVGDVDSRLEMFEDWQKQYETGVVYYLKDGVVRGAMMCNVWDKVASAREMIKRAKKVNVEELRGAIKKGKKGARYIYLRK